MAAKLAGCRGAWFAAAACLAVLAACGRQETVPEGAASGAQEPRGFVLRRAVLLAIAPGRVDLETEGPWLSGVIAETRDGPKVQYVAAHVDGTSSVDTLDENVLIGDRRVAAVRAANEAYLDAAWADISRFERTLPQPASLLDADPATAPAYPPDGQVQFFALTDRGLQATAATPVAAIENDPSHPLRKVYDASRATRAAIIVNPLRPRRAP